MATRVNHQEIVKKLLDAKAVDFANIAKVVAEVGPAVSLADEPWEGQMPKAMIGRRLSQQ